MKDYCNKSIAANYIKGIEAVGGKIYFDENGLTFKSHKINIQRGETRIEYKDISKVEKRNTLGIIPNGISVFTKDGMKHKFAIFGRKNVIEYLESKI